MHLESGLKGLGCAKRARQMDGGLKWTDGEVIPLIGTFFEVGRYCTGNRQELLACCSFLAGPNQSKRSSCYDPHTSKMADAETAKKAAQEGKDSKPPKVPKKDGKNESPKSKDSPQSSAPDDGEWTRGQKITKKEAGKYNKERASPRLGPKKSPHLGPKKSPHLGPKKSPHLGPKKSPHLGAKKNPRKGPMRSRSDSMEELKLDSLEKNFTKSPYTGPNPTKDRMREGAPACETYFGIRKAMGESNDDVEALKKLLPAAVHNGQDFRVWPRQCLLLHGLVKQGCMECVTYLVKELDFDINYKRAKDGCTPLHNAFYNLQGEPLEKMVHRLVELGADQTVKNKYGEPPCMFAFKAAASPLLSPMTMNEGISPLDELDELDDLSLEAPATPTTAAPDTPANIFTAETEAPPQLDIQVQKVEYSKQLPSAKTGEAAELYNSVLKATLGE